MTTAQRIDWMIDHEDLWHGYPLSDFQHQKLCWAMRDAGIYRFHMGLGAIQERVIVLVEKARTERLKRIENHEKANYHRNVILAATWVQNDEHICDQARWDNSFSYRPEDIHYNLRYREAHSR